MVNTKEFLDPVGAADLWPFIRPTSNVPETMPIS